MHSRDGIRLARVGRSLVSPKPEIGVRPKKS
jgi:hypothetical protein